MRNVNQEGGIICALKKQALGTKTVQAVKWQMLPFVSLAPG